MHLYKSVAYILCSLQWCTCAFRHSVLQYFLFKLSFVVPFKKAVNDHSHLRIGLHGLCSHFVSFWQAISGRFSLFCQIPSAPECSPLVLGCGEPYVQPHFSKVSCCTKVKAYSTHVAKSFCSHSFRWHLSTLGSRKACELQRALSARMMPWCLAAFTSHAVRSLLKVSRCSAELPGVMAGSSREPRPLLSSHGYS